MKLIIIILSLILVLSGCQYLTTGAGVPLSSDCVSNEPIIDNLNDAQILHQTEGIMVFFDPLDAGNLFFDLKELERYCAVGEYDGDCDGEQILTRAPVECRVTGEILDYNNLQEREQLKNCPDCNWFDSSIKTPWWVGQPFFKEQKTIQQIKVTTFDSDGSDIFLFCTNKQMKMGLNEENLTNYLDKYITCPSPSDCVSNEPTTIDGYYNAFNNLWGDTITIGSIPLSLQQIEGDVDDPNFVGYGYAQGNLMILVMDFIHLPENSPCPINEADIPSSRYVGKKTIKGIPIYTFKKSDSAEAEIADAFCSNDNQFYIKFEPVGELSPLLDYEQDYFQTFYTCPEPTPTPEPECTIDSDCPQNVCFGRMCVNGKCEQKLGTPAPPVCSGENYYGELSSWKSYPDCKWVCLPPKECTPNWQCPNWTNVACVNDLKTRICKDLNNCQADKTEYISCEEEKTFIQQYGLILIIAGIIGFMIYLGTKKK